MEEVFQEDGAPIVLPYGGGRIVDDVLDSSSVEKKKERRT